MLLPQEYIVQKFYQYAGYPKYKKSTNTYEAGCPICREGSSWLKKSRCYYIVDKSIICCHNCGWYGKPLKWIQEVTNQTYEEIIKEVKTYDVLPSDILQEELPSELPKNLHKLPLDCINLFDTHQTDYHKDSIVVQKALELIKRRRLDTAVNRPKSLWLSLTDKVHKNRLIIPFYQEQGPIDAFFVRNGTAVAGIQENSSNMFSTLQQSQINSFKTYNRVWVLDSQWQDDASRTKTKRLIDAGETVFIWPEKVGTIYKDINDACMAANIDEISPKFILSNAHSGLKAKLLMSEIKS